MNASGVDRFVTRVSSYQNVMKNSNNPNYDGARVDCIVSGYSNHQIIEIRCRKVNILCLGLTKEIDRPVAPIAICHLGSAIDLHGAMDLKADLAITEQAFTALDPLQKGIDFGETPHF